MLLFTFFMISDPKTTPDSRAGRILFAALVALGAGYVSSCCSAPTACSGRWRSCSPLVPLIDRLLPGARYAWRTRRRPAAVAGRDAPPSRPKGAIAMKRPLARCSLACRCPARRGRRRGPSAFCGFYVAKADTKLFNKASQVVLVRDGDRTVLTMANDFQGEPKEFALVMPVPTVHRARSRSTSATRR